MLSTATKIRIARTLSGTLLRLGLRPERRVRRKGVWFNLDIREGIDLSLFLFGAFQSHVIDVVKKFVEPDGVVIDVGANVGAVTLPVASYLRSGHVHAFEPTDFAYAKLEKNLALNPQLAERVTLWKSFVAESASAESSMTAYSSWPLTPDVQEGQHPVHKGVAKKAECGQTTIDELVATRKLAKVSLIKVDTDGHELAVLSGASKTLEELRPVVIFEACQYLMESFDDFIRLFESHRYTIRDIDRGDSLTAEEFARRCPPGGGLDLIALPNERLPGKSRTA